MSPSTNKDLLLWLLVILCTAGVALLWFPGFIGTIWDFSDAVGTKGQKSQSAFMENLKQIQAEFEKSLDERQKIEGRAMLLQTIEPLDEKKLREIKKELETYSAAATQRTTGGKQTTPKAHCTRQGGIYTERAGARESLYGICAFTDGSECHALLFMRGKCHVGQYKRAEDGIPQWPDLIVDVSSMQYCRRIDGILKETTREVARGVCIKGTVIRNAGIAPSMKAALSIDEKKYSIPPLKPNESFTLPSPIIVQKTPDLPDIDITLTTHFQEIDKENNTYHYATKETGATIP